MTRPPVLDIDTEPEPDPDTLRQLGPLAALAGVWEGRQSLDVHPTVDGQHQEPYVERAELEPIDAQTNGPQLFYGLRYHTRITRPGAVDMFHDQVGYWLWEPATGTVSLTLAIPRGLVALASGPATPAARRFTLRAGRGSITNGILANPFLDTAFQTTAFEITVTVEADGSWSYEQTTTLQIQGRSAPFLHTDRNTLRRVAAPVPNPTALQAARTPSASV